MRRFIVVSLLALTTAAVAWAGNPHFISVDATRSGNTLTVSGKEAGLGNESQVHIVITATASCINPGDHHPRAANKVNVSAEGDFPVQNGKALFSLTLTPAFQPECSPPMTIVFSDIVVTDATSGISKSIPGTF